MEWTKETIIPKVKAKTSDCNFEYKLEEKKLRAVCCTDHEKEQFWDELGEHMRTIGASEHVLLGGDLNGHEGAERDGFPKSTVVMALAAEMKMETKSLPEQKCTIWQ